MSLPYPEPGIRLIRQDQIETFNAQLETLKTGTRRSRPTSGSSTMRDLKSAARDRLGSLYNPADYPASLLGLFQVTWDFPSVEPPDYLQQLSPDMYQQECERVAARFDEAVRLAEQAFMEELQQLVAHLTERLTGQSRWPAESIQGFGRRQPDRVLPAVPAAERPQSTSSWTSWSPSASRSSAAWSRRRCGTTRDCGSRSSQQLSQVENVLDSLLVDRPRRNILPPAAVKDDPMQLVITPDGTVRCVYGEELDLHIAGQLTIARGSHVEPDDQGQWWADCRPSPVRDSARSFAAVKRCRPKSSGWNPIGSARPADVCL